MSANSPEATNPAGDPDKDCDPKTPAERLEKLKEKLAEAEAQNAQLDKRIGDLKGGIAGLAKDVTEIEQKAKGWEAARKALAERKDKEQAYLDIKKPMLEATVRDKKLVEGKKKEFDAKVNALDKGVGDLLAAEKKQTQELAEAKVKTAEKRKEYEALLNLAQRNDALLKDVEALEAQAEKEDEKKNVARMYFLILEMEEVMKKLDLPDLEKYVKDVNRAQTEAGAAAEAEQTAQELLARTQAELKAKQKELADAKADRRKQTLAEIPEGNPAAAPA